jgi:two-component system response regulator VicR
MVRILVADDSEALRTMFQETLVGEGFEVVVATDGQEALDLFHTAGPFDLVLLDGDMPRLTGREVARKVRAESLSLPVVIVSGTVHISEAEAQALGVTFLLKPVLPNDLVRQIRRLLGTPGP